MTYPEALRYLESFIDYEKLTAWSYKQALKLERIRDFLATVDNPQEALACLHVAGTKGKGSTCAFLAYILKQAGYKVGLYTSPHLSDFRERIRILSRKVASKVSLSRASIKPPRRQGKEDFEGMISKDELADLVKRLRPAIEKYSKNSQYGPLSFFEVYTALAFSYFKEKKTDFLVLETGLGGRLDATNVVEPLVCAVTPISYEHTQRLGNTLREIATEKAGIIKSRRSIVISAPQEKEARDVIRERCKELELKLFEVGKDIIFKEKDGKFSIDGLFGRYPNLKINFLGRHQLVNAGVAVGAIESLKLHGINVGAHAIRTGLLRTVWPGRLEIIGRSPWVVLDGAQNFASAQALKQAIKENFFVSEGFAQKKKIKKLILVFGISKDKDIEGTSRELTDLADVVVLTRSSNPRAQAPEELAEYFKGKPTYITQSVKKAKKMAAKNATEEDMILVTGSLFVVGEFRDGNLQS